MREAILSSAKQAVLAAKLLTEEEGLSFIEDAAKMIAECYKRGGKILVAGNGGSLCDAMHFAEELTGYYRQKRRALGAIALSDPGHLTCVANDTDFNQVFARSIEALAKSGDIVILLTTSGNSKNLLNALEQAKEMDCQVISFLGKTGGMLKGLSDLEWIVEGFPYSDRIQEVHMAAIHMIIEMVEKILFEKSIQKDLKPPSEDRVSQKAPL